jgi:hypothetical protein
LPFKSFMCVRVPMPSLKSSINFMHKHFFPSPFETCFGLNAPLNFGFVSLHETHQLNVQGLRYYIL